MKLRIIIVWCCLCFLTAVSCREPVSGQAETPLDVECRAIRGANYTPSYTSTSIGTWLEFNAEIVDRELEFAHRLKLNSVRVFLSYVAYEKDSKEFLDRLQKFVTIAARHKIRPMFVLFDSCFGKEPSVDSADSKMWVNNPGYSRISADDWSPLETYVGDVVLAYAGDSRVLMWDVMNEPMADFEHVTREERDRIWEFCLHFCGFVKARDASHPITVGHAVVEYIPKTADLVDVLSVHSYSRYDDWLQQDIDLALLYGRRHGKPVIFTEFGNPGAGQKYGMALDVIERNRLGFYFWELMISQVMFKNMAGLVYPDGTVRDLQPIAALLHEELETSTDLAIIQGFGIKSEGGIPLKQPPDGSHLRKFLAESGQWSTLLKQVENAPRTRANIISAAPGLALLGRHLCRPDPEAQKVFELALSIPHHFRLGREEQAIQDFEELLRIVSRVVATNSSRGHGSAIDVPDNSS